MTLRSSLTLAVVLAFSAVHANAVYLSIVPKPYRSGGLFTNPVIPVEDELVTMVVSIKKGTTERQ